MRCVEYGEKYGVIIGWQNHGGMLFSADEMLIIMKRVESDWFGLIIDTGGFTRSDPHADIERVIPCAANGQVMEYLNGQKGPKIDLKRIARLIWDANHRGNGVVEAQQISLI